MDINKDASQGNKNYPDHYLDAHVSHLLLRCIWGTWLLLLLLLAGYRSFFMVIRFHYCLKPISLHSEQCHLWKDITVRRITKQKDQYPQKMLNNSNAVH